MSVNTNNEISSSLPSGLKMASCASHSPSETVLSFTFLPAFVCHWWYNHHFIMANQFEFVNQASLPFALRVYKTEDTFSEHLVRTRGEQLSFDHDILRVEGCTIQEKENPFDSAASFKPTFCNSVSEHYPSGACLSFTDLFGPRLSSSIKVVIIALASPADPRERNDIFVYDLFIKAGVPRENVQMLLEHQATVDASLAVLRAAAAACAANDALFIYIGSHGTLGSDGRYRWVLHKDYLLGDDVLSILRTLPSTVRCLMIADSCYSGALIEAARPLFEEIQCDAESKADGSDEDPRLTMLCSVQSDSVAMSGWRLVALLLDALQNECRFSFSAIGKYAQSLLKTPLETQKAQLAFFNRNSGALPKSQVLHPVIAPVSAGGIDVVNLTDKHIWIRGFSGDKMTGIDFDSLSTFNFSNAFDRISGMYWKQGDPEDYVPTFEYSVPNGQYANGAKLAITDLFGPRITASIKALVISVLPSIDLRLRADREVYEALVTAGLPDENVLMLNNQQASLGAVQAAFSGFERTCSEQDVFFLYLATETAQEKKEDVEQLGWGLADGDLLADALIDKLLALQARHIMLCIDSCSAGSLLAVLSHHPRLEAIDALQISDNSSEQRSLTVLCSAPAQAQFPRESQWQFHRVLISHLQTRGSPRISPSELTQRVQVDAQQMQDAVTPEFAFFTINA